MLNSYKIYKLFSLSQKLGIKPVFFIFYFFVIVCSSKAQENLVPNGDFEEYDHCPIGIADFSVSYWYSPTWGTCDYFNECNLADANVPNNYFGYQSTFDGSSYVGFGIVFDSVEPSIREYLQVELISSLEKDKFYYFSCLINKADSSNVCLKDIGIALSDVPIGGNFIHLINYFPQFTNSLITLSCNDDDWNKIEFSFKANGGEKYLTIGCFEEDIILDTIITHESTQGHFAYYYVDNVKLHEIIIEGPNVFTPNGDGINDHWMFSLHIQSNIDIQILNRWGQIVANCMNGSWDGNTDLGKECPSGIYFYKASVPYLTGYIHLIR